VSKKVVRKPLVLEKYDGSVPLETFLAKFQNCARYNGWSNDDRGVFLRDSLTGSASQILWEISDDVDFNEIIRLLRNRFGSLNQMERYRAELRGRRRKKGETVQNVYQDIKRLMALAFPSQSGEMYEVIARDAFLDSLSDPSLRVRVLDQSPKTLDEALTTVLRMEAYSTDSASSVVDDNNYDDSRKRVRFVSASQNKNADSEHRIKMLEQHVLEQGREIDRLRLAANHADGTCFRTKDSAAPPAGSSVTSDNHFGGQTAAGGYSAAGQTAWADNGYNVSREPEFATTSQAGSVPAGHMHYGMGTAAAYQPQPQTGRGFPAPEWGGNPAAYQGHAGWNTASGAGTRALWEGDPMANYSGHQTRGVDNHSGPQPPPQWNNSAQRPRRRTQHKPPLPRDVCSKCFSRGHWRAQCPVPSAGPTPNLPDASYVQGVSGKLPEIRDLHRYHGEGKNNAGPSRQRL